MKRLIVTFDEYLEELQKKDTQKYIDLTNAFDNYMNTGIDGVWWSAIYSWFYDRDVYSPKFFDWFMRKFEITKDRLRELQRIEPGRAEFDWFVTNYEEFQRQHVGDGSDSNSSNMTSNTTGSESYRDNGSTSSNNKITNSEKSKTVADNVASSLSNSVSLGKSLPMTASYKNGITFNGDSYDTLSPYPIQTVKRYEYPTNPQLNWTSPTEQSQSGGTERQNSTANSTSSGEAEQNTSGSATTSSSHTSNSNSNTGMNTSGSTTRRDSSLDRMIRTGRTQKLDELVSGARDYIVKSNSFLWLRGELEPCFVGVYDLDRYEEWEADDGK